MPYYPEAGGILPGTVTNKYLADMPAGTVKGRTSASAGPPQDIAMPLSYRNILGRNGGFEVWQRGAGGAATFSIAASSAQYTADGWYLLTNAGQATLVGQQPGQVINSRWALHVQRSPGQTGVGQYFFEFPDTDEIVSARNSIVTLSMTLLAGPNWSPVSGNMLIGLYVGTGAAARRSSGTYTGEVIPINVTQPLTTTPTRYSFTSTVVVPAGAAQASVVLLWTPVGTAGASDWFMIDDVQLEIGSVATPFERRPFESELLACRRHYQKSFDYGVAPAQNGGTQTMWCISQAVAASSGMQTYLAPFGPTMRNTPTITLFNPYATNAQARNVAVAADCTSTAVNISGAGGFNMLTVTPAASAPGNLIGINWTADAGI